ncbi:MAG TPA: MBL fold metallo-hydrolase, partial [Mycolicibacterium fallax]|nr:MBL fold metallo-hydrolase [Mycolicibacterium fallax]
MEQNPPAPIIAAAHARQLQTLPLDDDTDFADADRGFLGRLSPGVVTAADGRVVWDNDAYDFLAGDAP